MQEPPNVFPRYMTIRRTAQLLDLTEEAWRHKLRTLRRTVPGLVVRVGARGLRIDYYVLRDFLQGTDTRPV